MNLWLGELTWMIVWLLIRIVILQLFVLQIINGAAALRIFA